MQKISSRSDLPLNALRAFEVSARCLSFTRAAHELNVTQGAVSRQVKALETKLGIKLFYRLHRKLVLTDQGHALFHPLSRAMDDIAATVDSLRQHTDDLNLKVHPTFAIRWLIPRLHKFQVLFPRVQVRFTTSSINADFRKENFDIAVTYRGSEIPGVIRHKILEEQLTPVCSPALLTGTVPLKHTKDLKHHQLLHNSPDQREWRTWARQVNVEGLSFAKGQVFEIDDAALQAATAGLGVALGDRLLIREDLASNRLTEPFEFVKVDTGAYYLSWLENNGDKPGLAEFSNWLINEISNRPDAAALG